MFNKVKDSDLFYKGYLSIWLICNATFFPHRLALIRSNVIKRLFWMHYLLADGHTIYSLILLIFQELKLVFCDFFGERYHKNSYGYHSKSLNMYWRFKQEVMVIISGTKKRIVWFDWSLDGKYKYNLYITCWLQENNKTLTWKKQGWLLSFYLIYCCIVLHEQLFQF